MKNPLKIILLVVAVALVIGLAYYGKISDQKITQVPVVSDNSDVLGCYVAKIGKDVYSLNLQVEEAGKLRGTLYFKNFEKDSSKGSFVGTLNGDILLGQYFFSSEGMDSVRQVIFRKEAGGFVEGFGPVDEKGENFTDFGQIKFDPKLTFAPSTECPL